MILFAKIFPKNLEDSYFGGMIEGCRVCWRLRGDGIRISSDVRWDGDGLLNGDIGVLT